MARKYLTLSALALSVALMPGTAVFAGGSDIVGGIIGGMIGGAIVNEANKNRRTTTRTVTRRPAVDTYQREQNREVQTALNYFGYPVGTPDGVIGAKSRAAISQYQMLLGYPATGQITEIERQVLVTGYQRAMIGGPQVQKAVNGPQGMRGLLIAQRDEMLGGGGGSTYAGGSIGGLPPDVSEAVDEIARNSNVEAMQLIQRAGFIQLADLNNDGRTDYMIDTSVTGSGFWCNGPACTVRVFASTPQGYQRNDFQIAGATPASFRCTHGQCEVASGAPVMAAQPVAPVPMPGAVLPPATMAAQPVLPTPVPAMPGFGAQLAAQPAAPVAAMPSFGAAMVPQPVSAKTYCAQVQAKTGVNGGVQNVAMMSDPAQALGEQFCQVSAEAQAEGTALVAQIQGFTPAQISEQCRGFGALLADQVALLGTTPRDDMIASIQGFLAQSGMDEAQTAGTARVCLAMGYADDEMPVALGSALVLAGTGNMVYAEFIGHHLAAGVGTDKHPDLALDWYELGLNALSIGQTPVFVPGQPDRAALIQKAAFALNGRSDAPQAAPTPVAAPSGGLAGFGAAAAQLLQTGAQGSQP
ncbi:MAG: peptidoglycan-binding domain-containing protein [Paracoccaceae bacterium]|nr:peptidoglycan-binding domain-containing protein [Paracoccaceae bacterium]